MARKRTFLNVTMERTGSPKRTGKILGFCLAWIAVHAELGHRPTVDEYAEYWRIDTRTAYREQADFRDAWPEFMTPTDVAITLGLNPSNAQITAPIGWLSPLEVA